MNAEIYPPSLHPIDATRSLSTIPLAIRESTPEERSAGGQQSTALRPHRINLQIPIPIARKRNPPPVRRPRRMQPPRRMPRNIPKPAAVQVHHVNPVVLPAP